ncbi:hypothetical protein [Planktotalea arctica]|uniref:hypothetical protein n=1 Tax=Planktotalea arctica TaxID=1481893 RepID=UPI000A175A1D|nr:hypothetical protein [Planktotalea arctica]
MPNIIAFGMLAIWPLVTLVMFRRLPVEKAFIWAIVAGYLILPPPPAGFDFPLLPAFDKDTIPSLSVFVICFFMYGHRGSLMPDTLLPRIVLGTFILSPMFTVLTNGEPVFYGQVGIRGLGMTDMLALCMLQFITVIPFLIARKFLVDAASQKEILKIFVFSGLAYSLLMLIEIRLSPQLNTWIYGYFQHVFGQSVRFGGYRPLVFLYHGLWVALFAMTVVIAALAIAKAESGKERLMAYCAGAYMLVVLVLCKSMGSLIFAVFLIPVILLFKRNAQIKIAALVAALAVGYPLLKGFDVVPVQWMLDQAAAVSEDRSASLKFRFDNEIILMERAMLKPLFGWGSWGRNHILDPVSGILLTVTDGRWIIAIGVYGWVGFLAEFGLLTLPIFMIWREAKPSFGASITPYAGAISLLLAINVLDMIPNATLTPLTWLFSGALIGYAESLRAERIANTPGMEPFRWRTIL